MFECGSTVRSKYDPAIIMTIEAIYDDQAECVWFMQDSEGWCGPMRRLFDLSDLEIAESCSRVLT